MKKICWLLALMLCLGVLSAGAEETAAVWSYSWANEELSGYEGPGGDVTLPTEAEGYTVRRVGSGTLSGRDDIASVTVPEGVLVLGANFLNTSNGLERISLPSTLQVIENGSLFIVPKLKELTIPQSVRVIEGNLLGGCDSLETVTFLGACPWIKESFSVLGMFSENVTVYVPDDQLDAYREALTEVDDSRILPSGQNALPYIDGDAELGFDKATGTVTGYFGHDAWLTIPSEIDGVPVKRIGEYAFEKDNYVHVVEIPEGVTEIGAYAFSRAYRLVRADLPDSVETIGEHAFDYFKGKEIHLPAALTAIAPGTFAYSYLTGELYVPENVTVIGDEAFKNAYIQEAYFPAGLQSIGESAFENRKWLTYLYFDAKELPDMAETAFAGSALEDVDIHWQAGKEQMLAAQQVFDAMGFTARVWRMQNPNVDYPWDGLSTYSDGLMTGYTGQMTHIRPWDSFDGVDTVGIADGALKGNQMVTYFSAPYNDVFTYVGAEAFADSALEEVDLFDSVTEIGPGAFRGSHLREVTLPASLEKIGEYAFADCKNLSSVTVLCDPAIIPDTAFQGCPLLGIQDALCVEGALAGTKIVTEALIARLTAPVPTEAPTPVPTEAPTPVPTEAPTEAPAADYPQPDAAAYECFGGVWYLASMENAGQQIDPADYGLVMTLTLNADGTVTEDMGGDVSEGRWIATAEGATLYLDGSEVPVTARDGAMVASNGEMSMTFTREPGEPAPAFAEPVEAPDAGALSGLWQADVLAAEGMRLPVDSEEVLDSWQMLFGSTDTTIRIDGEKVTYFGIEADFVFRNGRLENISEPIEGLDTSYFDQYASLLSDGGLAFQIMGFTVYCHRAEETTPTPATPAGGIPLEIKLVAVGAEMNGVKIDAASLGGEYAVVFHANGKADFTLVGTVVPGLSWEMDGNDAVLDYYGHSLRFTPDGEGLSMNYFDAMTLRMLPAEE